MALYKFCIVLYFLYLCLSTERHFKYEFVDVSVNNVSKNIMGQGHKDLSVLHYTVKNKSYS